MDLNFATKVSPSLRIIINNIARTTVISNPIVIINVATSSVTVVIVISLSLSLSLSFPTLREM